MTSRYHPDKLSQDQKEEIIRIFKETGTVAATYKRVGLGRERVRQFLLSEGVRLKRGNHEVQWVTDNTILCKTCNLTLDADLFKHSSGHHGVCKLCRNIRTRMNTNVKNPFNERCRTIRYRARKAGIPFDLTPEFLRELNEKQQSLCFYTDLEMLVFGLERDFANTFSVDKVVPELGYIQGNVVLCCNRINTLKLNLTLDEMRKWMPGWYKRLEEGGFIK